MVNQFYDAEIIKEYVMRGNPAIVKCSIPSFVADFVHVVSWADEDGTEFVPTNDYLTGIQQLTQLIDCIPPPTFLHYFQLFYRFDSY